MFTNYIEKNVYLERVHPLKDFLFKLAITLLKIRPLFLNQRDLKNVF